MPLLAAIKAIEAGVAGIIVSNHGARQLDYAPATISVLEEVIPYLPDMFDVIFYGMLVNSLD